MSTPAYRLGRAVIESTQRCHRNCPAPQITVQRPMYFRHLRGLIPLTGIACPALTFLLASRAAPSAG